MLVSEENKKKADKVYSPNSVGGVKFTELIKLFQEVLTRLDRLEERLGIR